MHNDRSVVHRESARRQDLAYHRLRTELTAMGPFEPDTLGYVLHCAWVIPAYIAGWWLLLTVQDPFLRIALAALEAFVMMQGAALGHEAGHAAVSRRPWVNAITGYLFMSLGSGSSQASWEAIHSGHHRHANSAEDPNLSSRLFCFTEADARCARGLRRWLTCHQPWCFWPVVTLMGAGFRLGSLRHMLDHPRKTRPEQALVLLHHVAWLALPGWIVGAGAAFANYLLVLWFCGVYLAMIFVANHLGHPVDAAPWSDAHLGRQAANTRNLEDSWPMRRFFVGLNSHIEHHLFPRISFTRLHRARAATRRCCESLGVPYHEVDLLTAVRELHRHNVRMAAIARHASRREDESPAFVATGDSA